MGYGRQGVIDNGNVLVVSFAIVIYGGDIAVLVAVYFGRTVADDVDRRCVVRLDASISAERVYHVVAIEFVNILAGYYVDLCVPFTV